VGRTHSITTSEAATTTVERGVSPVARTVDLLVATVALLLAAPLMGVLALAVRASSHGPVFHRDRALSPSGRSVTLLSFRTVMDGGGTDAHARLRSVVGAAAELPVTGVGRVLRRTRLDRLPRLLNLLAGHRSLFG